MKKCGALAAIQRRLRNRIRKTRKRLEKFKFSYKYAKVYCNRFIALGLLGKKIESISISVSDKDNDPPIRRVWAESESPS